MSSNFTPSYVPSTLFSNTLGKKTTKIIGAFFLLAIASSSLVYPILAGHGMELPNSNISISVGWVYLVKDTPPELFAKFNVTLATFLAYIFSSIVLLSRGDARIIYKILCKNTELPLYAFPAISIFCAYISFFNFDGDGNESSFTYRALSSLYTSSKIGIFLLCSGFFFGLAGLNVVGFFSIKTLALKLIHKDR